MPVIRAADVAKPFEDELRVTTTSKKDVLLVGLLANGDGEAKKYAEWTGIKCV